MPSEVKGDGGKSFAEIDAEIIEKYNRNLKYQIDREEKLLRQWEWRGNKLPPFNIEHMPNVRQRLSGAGMTAEDRVLRHQWIQDQKITEPAFNSDLFPRNWIRRVFGKPWDLVFRATEPILGKRLSASGRYFVPRILIALGIFYTGYYQVRYTPKSWEEGRGWTIYGSKPRILPGDSQWPTSPEKELDDFADQGYKSRKSLRD